jgi:hypothetical protein
MRADAHEDHNYKTFIFDHFPDISGFDSAGRIPDCPVRTISK